MLQKHNSFSPFDGSLADAMLCSCFIEFPNNYNHRKSVVLSKLHFGRIPYPQQCPDIVIHLQDKILLLLGSHSSV
jgi:hypothetical protein